ncbi:MAG TPA: pseudouridine synthase [Verrucomicrobiae bacterium]|jgi:23S rRNA (cytosine1962-C5)-methyltransferase|nr:pseudouridine synthase [Verrucomicrobiae bacterium]
MFSWRMVPCVIFEDEYLLVVAKPAGWNTHAPSPYAGEGIYDWLKHREPRWSSLAILHRLDKETSGVMVFGKTPLVNKSLTEQFTQHQVHKKYLLLTDREVPPKEFTVKTALVRVGEKYASGASGEIAETKFTPISDSKFGNSRLKMVTAEPLTGRTHQIRVHAAENGFPILGDTLYGGTASSRVFLHAGEIAFTHPATSQPVKFFAPVNFDIEPRLAIRTAVIEPDLTNAFRVIHAASDGWPGWFVKKLGDFLLSQSESPLNAKQNEELSRLAKIFSSRGAYHKILSRQVRRSIPTEASPQLVFGEAAPERFEILENGVRYEMSFNEGYSVGLFLDQRDNRRRFLTNQIAAEFPLFQSEIANRKSEILNCFAYTCGFSVCAAKAGARTTSLDLSKKYLEWGKRNFALNGLDPAAHDFIFGDTFDWLRRLAKKDRAFDAIALDPPTFSQSKEHGTFRAEKDFGKLVAASLPLVKPGGILFCSTNAADFLPEIFLAEIEKAVFQSRRKILQQHYFPQPPDFPISRAELAYLKTVWLRIG